MAYPDTPPTVDEIENNPVLKRELFVAINQKPEVGFQRINDICEKAGLDEDARGKKIASFYLNNKDNLDQSKVADHISGKEEEHKKLMKHFVDAYSPQMQGKGFVEAMRGYFDNFKAPGEGQKVDRFISAFASAYVEKNPNAGIPDMDSAYQMSYATVQLNSDAHNPANKTKMTYPQYKENLEYSMGLQKLDTKFLSKEGLLENIYKDVQSQELSPSYKKEPPSVELDSAGLKRDRMLGAVDKELGKKKENVPRALGMEEGTTAQVNGRKPLLGFLTGYKSTVTLTDKDGNKATMEISKPGIFSRKQPTVTIKPEGDSEGSVKLAGQIAGKFEAKATIKTSFAYQRDEMTNGMQQKNGLKTGKEVEQSKSVKQGQSKESPKIDRVKLSREGYRGEENLKLETAKKEVMNELGDVLSKRNKEGPTVGSVTGLKKPGQKQPGENLTQTHGKGLGTHG